MDEATPESTPENTTHLYRSTTNRVFGGVAAGLGDRFAIDANVVRVGFIVVTFLWGLGAVIYLALWVLVPQREVSRVATIDTSSTTTSDSPDVAPPRRPPSRSTSSLRPVVVLAFGVLLLVAVFASLRHGLPGLGGGLAGFWVLTLALLAVLALRKPGPRRIRRAFAIFLMAVVSVMIVITGAFAAFLATTGVPLHGGTGSRTWQPLSLAQTRHDYALTFGHAQVDLSAVRFPSSGFTVNASVGVGELEVVVPARAIVELRTHVGAGVSASSSSSSGFDIGPFSAVPQVLKTPASRRNAAHLILTVQVGIGRLQVRRAG